MGEFVSKEDYDHLEKRVFKLEHRVKNLSWALSMFTDLFDENDFANAVAKYKKEHGEG